VQLVALPTGCDGFFFLSNLFVGQRAVGICLRMVVVGFGRERLSVFFLGGGGGVGGKIFEPK